MLYRWPRPCRANAPLGGTVPKVETLTFDEWKDLVAVAGVELRTGSHSVAVLGPVAYVAAWPTADREEFCDDLLDVFGDCSVGDVTPIEAFVRVMVHKFDPVSDRIAGRLNAEDAALLRARLNR